VNFTIIIINIFKVLFSGICPDPRNETKKISVIVGLLGVLAANEAEMGVVNTTQRRSASCGKNKDCKETQVTGK
jgi:hypothetical protein